MSSSSARKKKKEDSPPTETEAMFICQNVFKLKSQSICIPFVYHRVTTHSSCVEAVILILWGLTMTHLLSLLFYSTQRV